MSAILASTLNLSTRGEAFTIKESILEIDSFLNHRIPFVELEKLSKLGLRKPFRNVTLSPSSKLIMGESELDTTISGVRFITLPHEKSQDAKVIEFSKVDDIQEKINNFYQELIADKSKFPLNLAIVITGEGKPEVYLIEVTAENAFKFNRR